MWEWSEVNLDLHYYCLSSVVLQSVAAADYPENRETLQVCMYTSEDIGEIVLTGHYLEYKVINF